MRESAASSYSCRKSLFSNLQSSRITFPDLGQRLAGLILSAALLFLLADCGGGNTTPPPQPAPTITSFAPASGGAGTAVAITGTNLTGAKVVTFNGRTAASFSVDSSTQITATVAGNSSTGRITVATSGGTAFSAINFIINSPTISGFNPTNGIAGTSVTITGNNFTGATAVKFNGVAAASFTINNDAQITATVAGGSSTGRISVTTPNGATYSSTNFALVFPPAISRIDPGSGPVGTPVVVRGGNFSGVTAVAINGTTATSLAMISDTQIIANVATGTTSGKVTVTNAAGTATSGNNFTVTTGTDTLDLTIDGLYITQATQDYPDPIVPLVQNRSAWVRVFVTANQTSSVTPQVKVDFINGTTTNTLTIPAPSAAVPMTADVTNASTSWNAVVPAAWIQAGTQVVATVDSANAIPEADESNNTFAQNEDVRNLLPWKITLVPVKTKDGRQGSVGRPGQTPADWVDFAKRIHPVPDVIDAKIGGVLNSSVPTLQSDGTGWGTVLNEIGAKRVSDGATGRYYYGAVNVGYSSGVAGLAQLGIPVAMGWDSSMTGRGNFAQILAHEVGHNFNRKHNPCGGPDGVDPNYPYPGAIIGVPGWDVFASNNNLMPSSYLDVMSYCGPYWVSDYTYVGVLNFRASNGIGVIEDGSDRAVPPEGLLVWGRIEDGQFTLEPAFRIPVKDVERQSGPYTWEAQDAYGRALASMSFRPHEVSDLPGDRSLRMFSFVVPLDTDVLNTVESMHVKLEGQELARSVSTGTAADLQSSIRFQDGPNGRVELVWDSARYPVLMIGDASSGEVRGFLRDGFAEIEGAPRELEVRAPDGTGAEPLRHRRIEP